jgi:hypothetical protein
MRIIRRLHSLIISIKISRPKIKRPSMGKRWRIYLFVYFIETIVVMIGVTAGFGLTNWAESNKEKKLVDEYMKNLSSDLENDVRNLTTNDSLTSQKIQEMTNLLIILKTNDLEQTDSVGKLLKSAFENVLFFYPSQTTYESIKQGGQVNIIKDIKLKNDLIYLYDFQYAQLKINETVILNSIRQDIEPFIVENFDLTEYRVINQEKLFDYRFANLIQQLIYDLSKNITYYKEALAKCEEIRDKVNNKKTE